MQKIAALITTLFTIAAHTQSAFAYCGHGGCNSGLYCQNLETGVSLDLKYVDGSLKFLDAANNVLDQQHCSNTLNLEHFDMDRAFAQIQCGADNFTYQFTPKNFSRAGDAEKAKVSITSASGQVLTLSCDGYVYAKNR